MKKKKTLLSFIFAICMLLGVGFALTGCGELPENELDLTANSKVYDGQAINVAAIAKDNANIMIEFKPADASSEEYATEAPKNVGSYTVRIRVSETPNYKALEVTRNFEITPKEVEVEWTAPAVLEYDKTAKVPTVEITNGILAGDTCEVTGALKAGENNVDVGEFTYQATLNNPNYKISTLKAEHSYTIEPKSVTLNWPNTEFTYNKTAQLPIVTVSAGLVDDDECEVIESVAENDDNVNVGSFHCNVTLSNSNYVISGQTSKQYSISKAYYGYLRQKFRRPDSDSWSVYHFKVGETLYCEAYTDTNDVFEGEVFFTLYNEGEGHYINQTGDATIEGNFLTATKYGRVFLQAHVAESRNYYSKSAAGVQSIDIEGLDCVEGEQYEVPTEITAKYGQTLEYVVLPQGFAWNSPTTSVGEIGEHSFVATFTPYNYEDVGVYLPKNNVNITVTVGKADPEYVAPTGLTAKYGQIVSEVELPEGFSWHTTGTPVGGIIGPNAHLVDYTPTDTEHYNVVTNILVYINVTKGDQNITVKNDSKEFDGDPITAADLGLSYLGNGLVTLEFKLSSDPDSAYSSAVAPNAAHEYSVRITVAESSYYLEGIIVVTFSIVMPE